MVASNQSPQDFLAGEPVEGTETSTTYWRRVPWLFRAVELRSNAVGSAPWRLMKGDTETANSATWDDPLGVLPNPQRLFWLLEAALSIWGMGYYWRERNRVKGLPLRYIVPSTIEPKIDETQGLLGFWRTLGTSRKFYTTDNLIYFWHPDPTVELGPPTVSPVGAALSAAGVLYNVDAFAAAFINRGAIKATLLTVEGNPEEGEKQRLKSWWGRAVTGMSNAFSSNVFSAAVKPVVVGEGLESLANVELTATRREDIATALGIPQTLLFSTGAGGLGGGGVVGQDERHFYDKTIRAECDFIEAVLNEQLWRPLGYRMEFTLDELDVFQEDEVQRAAAFKTYVDAGLDRSLVAEMVGLELPDGWEYADLDPDETEEPEPVPPMLAPFAGEQPQEVEYEDDREEITRKALDDLRAWRRKSKKAGRLAEFVSEVIPAGTMAAIRSADDWLAALDAAIAGPVPAVKAPREPDRAAEEALRRKLQATLEAQRKRVAQSIADSEDIAWDTIMAELRGVITPAIANSATGQAMAFANGLNIPIDISKANVAAWAWANQYSFELVKNITETSRQLVAQVVAQFVETPGMTIGDLAAALEQTFGATRAQAIAVTETTRAYTQANVITQNMLREMGVNTVRVWQTSKDDKTCEDICVPLDGLEESEWGDYADGPPAHVNCRCWTTSKVVRNAA